MPDIVSLLYYTSQPQSLVVCYLYFLILLSTNNVSFMLLREFSCLLSLQEPVLWLMHADDDDLDIEASGQEGEGSWGNRSTSISIRYPVECLVLSFKWKDTTMVPGLTIVPKSFHLVHVVPVASILVVPYTVLPIWASGSLCVPGSLSISSSSVPTSPKVLPLVKLLCRVYYSRYMYMSFVRRYHLTPLPCRLGWFGSSSCSTFCCAKKGYDTTTSENPVPYSLYMVGSASSSLYYSYSQSKFSNNSKIRS